MVVLTRALGSLVWLGVLGSCYDPAVRDCAVTCGGSGECADGQQCLGGYCVADGLTDACMMNRAAPDAPTAPQATTQLRITIGGEGSVAIGGAPVCDSRTSSDCTITVPQHVVAHAQAVAGQNSNFETWMGMTCPNPRTASCDFTPATAALTLAVKFKGGGSN